MTDKEESMATYKIGTKLGYDLANGMKPGDSITATDKSVWTKGADGKITVQHGGKIYDAEITYTPEGMANTTPTKTPIASMQYESPYAEQLKQTIADIQNSSWSGWDKNNDPSYQALRKEYLREADRTAEDTLARYAQNTGGIAGSQAITAASQAADYQKAKLSDAIPTLHDNAYSRYLSELQNKQNVAGLLMNAESQEQSMYYQKLSYAMNKWAQMGYADDEVASILGVAAGTPTSDQSYSDWAKAFEEKQYNASLSSGGSGGSGGSGTETVPGGTQENYGDAGIIETMLSFGNDVSAYEYLVSLGKNQSVTNKLWEFYESERDNRTGVGPAGNVDVARVEKAKGEINALMNRGYYAGNMELILDTLLNRGYTEEELEAALKGIGY